MNFEPPQRGFKTFLVLMGLGVCSFFLAKFGQVAIKTYTRANVTEQPKNVKISNLEDSTITISWQTGLPTTGYVEITREGFSTQEISTNIQKNHHLTIEGLEPNTLYGYSVGVGANLYPQTTELKTSLPTQKRTSRKLFGQVINLEGKPAPHTLVYANIKDKDGKDTPGISTTLSAITNNEGIFSINLTSAKTRDLTQPFEFSETEDLVEISAFGEDGSSTSVIINTAQVQPAPILHLGNENRILDLTSQPKVKGAGITVLPRTKNSDSESRDLLRKSLLKLLIR